MEYEVDQDVVVDPEKVQVESRYQTIIGKFWERGNYTYIVTPTEHLNQGDSIPSMRRDVREQDITGIVHPERSQS